MPCFSREKSLSACARRDKRAGLEKLTPHPVRPRAIRYHGLFGYSNAAQHLIVDDNWSPSSLTEQFANIVDMLTHRKIYKAHEAKEDRKRQIREREHLRSVCSDGRTKLKNISFGNNALAIRNILSSHRDMQRLYQRMPIHLIVDNITQRTFILRKERDRLNSRLTQRRNEFKNLLLKRADVENRIRYANEFILEDELHSGKLKKKIENSNVRIKAIRAINSTFLQTKMANVQNLIHYKDSFILQEEIASQILRKKIENSNVRVKAIGTINNTYKKLVQILMNDEIFYEPILFSLEGDMEDQANFIKHIVYLGKPALAKLKVLGKEYLNLQNKSRKNLQAKIKMLASLQKPPTVFVPTAEVARQTFVEEVQHYTRQTKSMTMLKAQLATIEDTIKNLKLVTFCSQAKEIYPRVRQQMENNRKLTYTIQKNFQLYESLKNKKKYCSLLEEVLINNLSEEEINRHERIRELQIFLKADLEFEQESTDHVKNRSHMYVIFRIFLWNLINILMYVDRQPQAFRVQYPNSYLKLPLLKFEMLNMHAIAPELYEEDLHKLMALLKRKVYKLMQAYNRLGIKKDKLPIGREKYHQEFLNTIQVPEVVEDEQGVAAIDDDYVKAMMTIPNSKQLKALSAKVCEEVIKRDE